MPIIRDPKQNQFESNFGILVDGGEYRAYRKQDDDIKRILPAGWEVTITDGPIALKKPIRWDKDVWTVVNIVPLEDNVPPMQDKQILKKLKNAIKKGDLVPGTGEEYKIETYE